MQYIPQESTLQEGFAVIGKLAYSQWKSAPWVQNGVSGYVDMDVKSYGIDMVINSVSLMSAAEQTWTF